MDKTRWIQCYGWYGFEEEERRMLGLVWLKRRTLEEEDTGAGCVSR